MVFLGCLIIIFFLAMWFGLVPLALMLLVNSLFGTDFVFWQSLVTVWLFLIITKPFRGGKKNNGN